MEVEKDPEIYRDEYCNEFAHLALVDGARFQLHDKSIADVKALIKEIENFKVFDGDVFVSSFPKSGTTWIQEIVWQILKDPSDEDSKLIIEDKFPFLEFPHPGLDEIKKKPRPMLIKTHLHYRHLPLEFRQGHGKLIYIARNPKDVCVSLYHFMKFYPRARYSGDFDHFFRIFVRGLVLNGRWEDHVKDYWLHRNDGNVLFITFESLKEDAHRVIRQTAEFLGRQVSDLQVTKIAESTTFEAMKENPLLNYSWWKDERDLDFMRKGIVGDWKNHMTPEMENEMETKLLAPLKLIGLNFKDS